MAQEELLERGGPADERADAETGQIRDGAAEMFAIHIEVGATVLARDVMDAGAAHEFIDGALGLNRNRGAREMPQLVEEEQIRVAGQPRDYRHLLPVALRVRASLLRGVEVEALEERCAAILVKLRLTGQRTGAQKRV